jgi:glycolate oxidase iron-sulfur subunit
MATTMGMEGTVAVASVRSTDGGNVTTVQRQALPVLSSSGISEEGVRPHLDYELVLDCVHCGLCTASCPTYVETGHEADSPRGRIYLMRQVLDGVLPLDADVERHLDLCLNCRACETACPSGVQYGRILEPFRLAMAERSPGRQVRTLSRWQRWLLFHVFPYRWRNRWVLAPARLLQWTGLDGLLEQLGLLRLLPRSLRTMREMLPPLEPHYGSLPEVLEAEGRRRARVALFLGCVADALYPQTNYATARVLQANGCEVWIPPAQTCCGALHYHAAEEAAAQELAAVNCQVFGAMEGGRLSEVDAIITNAAGCGAQLKDYAHLMQNTPYAEAAARFQSKVRDVHEFLAELGLVPPRYPLPVRATYHDACHLRHAQQIAQPPRALLQQIPQLELVPLPESELCCGAAGSYNLTQPEMAARLGDRKVDRILSTGAQAVLTGNVGCLMQITRHLRSQGSRLWVAHPMDALWAAYSGDYPLAVSELLAAARR